MDNQLIQWLPLFGFGSVLTILIAIIGVGVGLWRNAGQAHAAIGKNIDDLRTEIRGVRTDLGAEIRGVRTDLGTEIHGVRTDLGTEIHGVRTEMRTDIRGVQAELSGLRKNVSGLQIEMGKATTDLGWIKNKLGGQTGSTRR